MKLHPDDQVGRFACHADDIIGSLVLILMRNPTDMLGVVCGRDIGGMCRVYNTESEKFRNYYDANLRVIDGGPSLTSIEVHRVRQRALELDNRP